MAFNFSGKKILVTGASRGIGRGIALALARSNCKVYALARTREDLESLASENTNIAPVVQDLTNWDETRATLDKLEVLDGLVNNAGTNVGLAPALDQPKEWFDTLLSINLYSAINCTQVIGRKMVDTGKKGSIVNISSHNAIRAYPTAFAYSVSKAGMDMATKQFALELGPHGIRVNSVNPTLTETAIVEKIPTDSNHREIHSERTPLGRNAEVDDVVGPVLYLLSDYASMVTGTVNLVDGGIACNITTKQ